jgi:hypothetical protein
MYFIPIKGVWPDIISSLYIFNRCVELMHAIFSPFYAKLTAVYKVSERGMLCQYPSRMKISMTSLLHLSC